MGTHALDLLSEMSTRSGKSKKWLCGDGALEFLGRTIYRSKDGESALYFGVNRQYMISIFESWGESIKGRRNRSHALVGKCSQGSCQEVW